MGRGQRASATAPGPPAPTSRSCQACVWSEQLNWPAERRLALRRVEPETVDHATEEACGGCIHAVFLGAGCEMEEGPEDA